MKWNVENIEQFTVATKELLNYIRTNKSITEATTVCLTGDLGAGKTTMTQIIGQALGVSETITSPTFVIKKIYETKDLDFKNIIHIDAYRLEGENTDILRLDEDFKNLHNLIIIEWPNLISDIIPHNSIAVTIIHTKEGRIIELK